MAGDLEGFRNWLRAYSPAGLARWEATLGETKTCATQARAQPKGAGRITTFINCRKRK